MGKFVTLSQTRHYTESTCHL